MVDDMLHVAKAERQGETMFGARDTSGASTLVFNAALIVEGDFFACTASSDVWG